MLEGGELDPDHPLPDEWRDYRLVKITGWTYDEVDAADAVRCDWALLFAGLEGEVAEERRVAELKAMSGRV